MIGISGKDALHVLGGDPLIQTEVDSLRSVLNYLK